MDKYYVDENGMVLMSSDRKVENDSFNTIEVMKQDVIKIVVKTRKGYICPVCRVVITKDIEGYKHLIRCIKPSTKEHYMWIRSKYYHCFKGCLKVMKALNNQIDKFTANKD